MFSTQVYLAIWYRNLCDVSYCKTADFTPFRELGKTKLAAGERDRADTASSVDGAGKNKSGGIWLRPSSCSSGSGLLAVATSSSLRARLMVNRTLCRLLPIEVQEGSSRTDWNRLGLAALHANVSRSWNTVNTQNHPSKHPFANSNSCLFLWTCEWSSKYLILSPQFCIAGLSNRESDIRSTSVSQMDFIDFPIMCTISPICQTNRTENTLCFSVFNLSEMKCDQTIHSETSYFLHHGQWLKCGEKPCFSTALTAN